MRRIIILLLAAMMTMTVGAQKRNTAKKKSTPTVSKSARKSVASKRTSKKTTKNTVAHSNSSIRGLQKERSQIQKKIRQQEQALRANQADVKKRLQNLMTLNSAIDERQKSIDGIQSDIHHIEGNIDILKTQLKTLEEQLQERKAKYIKSMRYMARHQTMQDKLMFIFSAKNMAQMYRRLRFVREYANYQRAQGEMVKTKQAQVDSKHEQLKQVHGQKNNLLYKDKKEKSALQGQQDEQQKIVASLKNQQKTIQKIIAEQRQKDAALNAQIDKLVAIEVEKARQRAIAEAKRKKEAAEAARRREAELARKKAEAEAAARENARRIEEAKAREAKLKAEAEAAAKAAAEAKKNEETAAAARRENAERIAKAAEERRAKTEQAAREAVAARQAAELKAKTEEKRNRQEITEARESMAEAQRLSTVDRMVSGGFEANRGRLPMPITGNYKIVSHYGQYNVEGLKDVKLDNKGINILGQPGSMARSIYDGEVSAVYGWQGTMLVMVRHGAYISIYCNLKSVSVSKGQKVSARQALGAIGADNILQFQLRKETAKLNPEFWLGR
ncbi:murein hydrolase activator EnvC family protein [Prevotella sp.]|uniref:murein hydrolase activator EnvC family protein n=1 Tax=Prevotella sp. TaxID=59823 RepID=UPI002F95113A